MTDATMPSQILIRLLLALACIFSCQATASDARSVFPGYSSNLAKQRELFNDSFEKFIVIADKSITLREDAYSLFQKLHSRLAIDEHLDRSDQETIYNKVSRYQANREGIESLIGPFDHYTDRDTEIIVTTDQPSSIVVNQNSAHNSKSNGLIINPDDELGHLMALDIKFWLAGKMLVYDNYVVVLARYLKKSDLRRQFDTGSISPKTKSFLLDTLDELRDEERYSRIIMAISVVEKIIAIERVSESIHRDRVGYNSYLTTVIEGSYAYNRIQEMGVGDHFVIEASAMGNTFWDSVDAMTDDATYAVSKMFGNLIGLYEDRKGKLYNLSDDHKSIIRNNTELLDIYLEKTPFRLTDQFIPGHWGHVAIWVGDSDDISELERLGVWEELPGIEAEARRKWDYKGPSFQSLIEQDHGVLEALRTGVEINSLDHFLNIDDMAILRYAELTDRQRRDYLIRAFSQVGKAYDFNFDVETNREIVCSELAFVVFADFDWPVDKIAGRFTVSPNHIAQLAVNTDKRLTSILLIHDGKKLPIDSNNQNLEALLEGRYSDIEF